jgi:hypothetical protein
MNENTLSVTPINDLLSQRFFIPAYQRGYRWTSRQVIDLLDDIATFQDESSQKGKEAFYCLQPVVVRKRDEGDWEVIDGQQRLTTVFLILKFLREGMAFLNKTLYSLHYETREDSGAFLENIDLTRINENIDYYHICTAYQTIGQWFSGRDGNYKLSLLQCLLNGNEIGKNVKVIWYELPNRDHPVEAFLRLNMGKISLTSAELIRALFLRSRNFASNTTLTQLQIAQEWDTIEKALQSDNFWYFIHKGHASYPTRIEYLFELLTQESLNSSPTNGDPYATFLAFNRRFTINSVDVEEEWLNVKKCFMTCEEWYGDRTLYHLVGYLIAAGVPILELMEAAKESKTKGAFRQMLRGKAFASLFGTPPAEPATTESLRRTICDALGGLTYVDHTDPIRRVLLLFNIATLLQNKVSNLRFPFDCYKKEDWDIEHIRSVASDMPSRIDARKLWLKNVLEYWTGGDDPIAQPLNDYKRADLCKEIIAILDAATFDSNAFRGLYDRILDYFGEKDTSETDHGLANLALLDAHTNRSYKNAVFPIKRRRIIDLDKEGTFVPLCTTNAFLKYYSPKVDNMMFWMPNDRTAYFKAIVESLVKFFTADNGEAA